jgi:hypothetical protein
MFFNRFCRQQNKFFSQPAAQAAHKSSSKGYKAVVALF